MIKPNRTKQKLNLDLEHIFSFNHFEVNLISFVY